MLARVGAFTLALIAATVGMAVWWVFSMLYPLFGFEYGPSSLRMDGPPFVISAVILAAGIILLQRRDSWSIVLLLVGAIALFIARLHDLAVGLALDFEWAAAHKLLFGFGCLETPVVTTPVNALRLLGLLIPIGFLCYATPLLEQHLTLRWSERRTAVRSHSR